MQKFEKFQDLALPDPLSKALVAMSFETPTAVQQLAIPPALEGKDVLGTAQTGTGKTGAFAIPLLSRLYQNPGKRALILSPTRELAAQIQKVMRSMSAGMKLKSSLVIGGESFYRQAGELGRGVDYIIATPGRLCDHLREGRVDLSQIGYLVLDEVDRMLDMGFQPQVEEIMGHVPKERQTFLFSATLPTEIQKLANSFLKTPVRVAIGSTTETISLVAQTTRHTTALLKNDVLLEEVEKRQGRIIIFARTKSRAERLAKLLDKKKHETVVLHGGRTQPQRKRALEAFRSGAARLMVATDLAGRGIDIDDIEHVINFDVPLSREDYIHRIGRTGRQGKAGEALTLVVPGDEDVERITTGKRPEKRAHPSAPQRPRPQARPHSREGFREARPRPSRPNFFDRPKEDRGPSARGGERPFQPRRTREDEPRPWGKPRPFDPRQRPEGGPRKPWQKDRPFEARRPEGDRPRPWQKDRSFDSPRPHGHRPHGPRPQTGGWGKPRPFENERGPSPDGPRVFRRRDDEPMPETRRSHRSLRGPIPERKPGKKFQSKWTWKPHPNSGGDPEKSLAPADRKPFGGGPRRPSRPGTKPPFRGRNSDRPFRPR